MAISKDDRAKQFLPFDALKGFKEALEAKEIQYDKRKELTEECCQIISDILNKIQKNDLVEIEYYYKRKYIKVIGEVQNVDRIKRKIYLGNEVVVNIDDIIEISIKE